MLRLLSMIVQAAAPLAGKYPKFSFICRYNLKEFVELNRRQSVRSRWLWNMQILCYV